ncbi:MAG: polysaccharide deacetylase [Melioribacteraceae bacterium]|nr:MAG: polysaccharide deacetylase [Melioribacteraceae bacterium]
MSIKKELNNSKPIISFTFDDFPSSAMYGAELLADSNLSATFYIAMHLMESSRFFTAEDIRWLVANNHELGCHTYDHKSMRFQTAKSINFSLANNQIALNRVIPGYKFQNFAYPFGVLPFLSSMEIPNSFTSARGIRQGINHRSVEIYNLKTVKLYEQIHSIEQIKRYLDKTLELNGWIIFYTHGIEKEYDRYSCSPEYFNEVLNLSKNSGFDILSVNQVVDFLIVDQKNV